MTVYRNPDEVPEEIRRSMVEGVQALGRQLRKWRAFADLSSVTGRWETADKTVVEITCDGEDRIWVLDPPGAEPIEVTTLVERAV